MIRLIGLRDEDFDWLMNANAPARAGLKLPPGGIDEPSVLNVIRRMNARLVKAGCRGTWMVIADDEVVGLCSYKSPAAKGQTEIGYGIAASRRNLGYATSAVGAIVTAARRDPALDTLIAETSIDNHPSERVLEKNGFGRTGRRHDPDDGPVNLWRLAL